MFNSVAECKTVDEKKQIFLSATSVMTQERFAQLTGVSEGQVRGMIEKGHLPSVETEDTTLSMFKVRPMGGAEAYWSSSGFPVDR